MGSKKIAAGEFKARCLALLDEVARTGEALVVTKRGQAVVKVLPAEQPAPIDGSVHRCEDLLSPAIDVDDWNMNLGKC